MEEGRNAFKMLAIKPTGNRPLGRRRRGCKINIRIILKKYVSVRGIGFIRLRMEIVG